MRLSRSPQRTSSQESEISRTHAKKHRRRNPYLPCVPCTYRYRNKDGKISARSGTRAEHARLQNTCDTSVPNCLLQFSSYDQGTGDTHDSRTSIPFVLSYRLLPTWVHRSVLPVVHLARHTCGLLSPSVRLSVHTSNRGTSPFRRDEAVQAPHAAKTPRRPGFCKPRMGYYYIFTRTHGFDAQIHPISTTRSCMGYCSSVSHTMEYGTCVRQHAPYLAHAVVRAFVHHNALVSPCILLQASTHPTVTRPPVTSI